MATDLFANGDIGLLIRTKVNNLNGYLQIAETDTLIAAGATTSIPIVTLTKNLKLSDWTLPLILVDILTGEEHTLECTTDIVATDTAIAVTSYTFTTDIAVGSAIYVKMEDLLALLYLKFAP